MGEMKRANAYEEEWQLKDRFASTLVIAASIIAAVRLARDDISRLSPRTVGQQRSSPRAGVPGSLQFITISLKSMGTEFDGQTSSTHGFRLLNSRC